MNDKRDRQHKKTADPVQTTGAVATGRSPLHNDPQAVVGPCACRDTIIPRSRRIS
jgi:hypothetical protein